MKQKKIFLLLLLLGLLLSGCAGSKAEPKRRPSPTLPAVTLPAAMEALPESFAREAIALRDAPKPALPVVLPCEASGEMEERGEKAVVDYSHTADGYVMAQFFAPTERKLKLRVTGPTTTYTYNLTPGEWAVFPLSDGNGSYRVSIYENTAGSRYALTLSVTFPAELKDEFAPFLRPNQYVNYQNAPNTLEEASRLCTGLEHPLEKVAAVYDYVVAELTYDDHRAATVKSGYLPELDAVLAEKKGICFDYAALMTAMLRSQQVPCKLVVGYAGSIYHAWISVWTEENGWVDGVIFFDGHSWKRMDPTFASYGENSEEILTFIESGNYAAKYLY